MPALDFRNDLIKPMLSGVLAAMLGFSWALATTCASRGLAPERQAGSRSVGSGLLFSNPFLLPGQSPQFPNGGCVGAMLLPGQNPQFPNGGCVGASNGYDLGDACLGSEIVRFISALGGVRPYSFSSTTIGISNSAELSLDQTGHVTGVISSGSGTGFTAVVADPSGLSNSGVFLLNTRAFSPNVFRFAMDRLPSGQVGLDYITRIEAINGDAFTVFSVVGGSVTYNGSPIAGLEFAGLTLFKDGTLAGRPLASGTMAFTARASKNGTLAFNRSNSAPDQTFTLNLEPQTSVQSTLATVSASLSNSPGLRGNSFLLTGIINTNGLNSSAFANNKFVLRIGGETFQTTLDAGGQSRSGNVLVRLAAPNGTLRVQLKNTDLSSVLSQGLAVDSLHAILVVEIEIGSTFVATEALRFRTRNGRGSSQFLYELGRDIQLGGLFQIVFLKAHNSSSGISFKATFLASHVRGQSNIGFGLGLGATVRIGPSFSQQLPLKLSRGAFVPAIQFLKVDTLHKICRLTTTPLPGIQTGVQPPTNAGVSQTFLLGFDLNTTTVFFSGEASRTNFPFGN